VVVSASLTLPALSFLHPGLWPDRGIDFPAYGPKAAGFDDSWSYWLTIVLHVGYENCRCQERSSLLCVSVFRACYSFIEGDEISLDQ
jgi:hypothetical protein